MAILTDILPGCFERVEFGLRGGCPYFLDDLSSSCYRRRKFSPNAFSQFPEDVGFKSFGNCAGNRAKHFLLTTVLGRFSLSIEVSFRAFVFKLQTLRNDLRR